MPRVNVTFTEDEYKHIEEVVKKRGITASEYVREMYYEGKKNYALEESVDSVVEIIDERLRAILKPQIERLASISAKGAIMSATSTFLNAQALADFVPPNKQKDFLEVYEKARLKGVAYVKGKVSDSEVEVQEAIKEEVKGKKNEAY
jgi:hypothetical protein